MKGSTAESETPEEIERRKFPACACGVLVAALALVIGYQGSRLPAEANQKARELLCFATLRH